MTKKIKKRELILKTAIKLFVDNGFENTSTEMITQEADVAKGTLFYHFKTREELINEAYLYIKRHLKDAVYEEVVQGPRFKFSLKILWVKYTKWALANRYEYEFTLMFYRLPQASEVVKQASEEIFGGYNKAISAELKKGTLKNLTLELVGYIFSGIHQAFVLEFSKKKKVDAKDIERSFEVFWDAIKQ